MKQTNKQTRLGSKTGEESNSFQRDRLPFHPVGMSAAGLWAPETPLRGRGVQRAPCHACSCGRGHGGPGEAGASCCCCCCCWWGAGSSRGAAPSSRHGRARPAAAAGSSGQKVPRGTFYTAVVAPGRCPAPRHRAVAAAATRAAGCPPPRQGAAAPAEHPTGPARQRSEGCGTGWTPPPPGAEKTE